MTGKYNDAFDRLDAKLGRWQLFAAGVVLGILIGWFLVAVSSA